MTIRAIWLTIAFLSASASAQSATLYQTLLDQAGARWSALGFKTRVVQVNGVALHVAEAGNGSPVVLLHGYPQSGEIWRHVAPELAKTHRVIIVDLRGMGLSGIAKDGYDL